jgi:hypothetical protein
MFLAADETLMGNLINGWLRNAIPDKIKSTDRNQREQHREFTVRPEVGVGTIADAARTSACATMRGVNGFPG